MVIMAVRIAHFKEHLPYIRLCAEGFTYISNSFLIQFSENSKVFFFFHFTMKIS